jgi:hypothetical protein
VNGTGERRQSRTRLGIRSQLLKLNSQCIGSFGREVVTHSLSSDSQFWLSWFGFSNSSMVLAPVPTCHHSANLADRSSRNGAAGKSW